MATPLYALSKGEIMEHRDTPACATCRRHECKSCRKITYRALNQSDWPCPACGSECHVLLAQHRNGVCRHENKAQRERAYRRYAPRTVVREGDTKEV